MSHLPLIDKIYLGAKDPNEEKYHLLINKRKSKDLKYLNDWKDFIEYSNDIYKNTEAFNPNKNAKYWSHLMIWLLICLVIKNLIN